MRGFLLLHGAGRQETDLLSFAADIAPGVPMRAPRGGFAMDGGFTFFHRRADRSIDGDAVLSLAAAFRADDDAALPGMLIVGYSSGAVFGAALLAIAPGDWAGAILLRPEPLATDFVFPAMPGVPVLILAGQHDHRRCANDAEVLAAQLRRAGARIACHRLEAGHGWAADGLDAQIARAWLEEAGLTPRSAPPSCP